MFDLENEIKNWRSNFLSEKKLSKETLDELESHLRESFEDLSQSKSEQEAFVEASALLGTHDGLAEEFKKNRDLSFWDLLLFRGSNVFLVLCIAVSVCITIGIWTKKGDPLLGIHVLFVFIGYCMCLALGVAGVYSILKSLRSNHGGMAFQKRYDAHCSTFFLIGFIGSAVGLVLGMIWAHNSWGRAWGWDPKEIGCLAVTIGALAAYVLQKKKSFSMVQLGQLCLVLSTMTLIGWFGASGWGPHGTPLVQFFYYGLLTLQLAVITLPFWVPKAKAVSQ